MSTHASGASGWWPERLGWDRVRGLGILVPFVILFGAADAGRARPSRRSSNLLNILDQQSATLIIAAAGTLVLVAGGIDLSVGSIYALAAVVIGALRPAPLGDAGDRAGIGAGLAVGLATAWSSPSSASTR